MPHFQKSDIMYCCITEEQSKQSTSLIQGSQVLLSSLFSFCCSFVCSNGLRDRSDVVLTIDDVICSDSGPSALLPSYPRSPPRKFFCWIFVYGILLVAIEPSLNSCIVRLRNSTNITQYCKSNISSCNMMK
jgi:hypothetical protein